MSEAVVRRCDFRVREGRKRKTCNAQVRDDQATVFSFDAKAYSVDLCDDCKLRARDEATIAELIQIARPEYIQVGPVVRRLLRGRSGDVSAAKIRLWAKEEGLDVGDAGVLSNEIKQAYEQANA
jgi:hypothetical protein